MVLIRHADVRVRPVADLARENHAEDARRVGLEREQLQVEHELRVARRTTPGMPMRALRQRDGRSSLGLGAPMRCSISRTESKYSSSFAAVAVADGRGEAHRLGAHRVEDARRLARCARARSALLPPSPNSRSNTTRGWFSVRFGVVSLRHDTVFT